MPILRPFRALRFDVSGSGLSSLLCPPYDIISSAARLELLKRDPHNAVRIELPADLGTAGPDDYRAAARTVAEWRTDGVLRKDRAPALTLHRMTWRTPGGDEARATGVLARLRLEPFGPGSGVLPHERTLGGPKEDRYALLRATGLNTSPIILLGDGSGPSGSDGDRGTAAALIEALTVRVPDVTAETDGVRHELWIVPTGDRGRDGGGERSDHPLGGADGTEDGNALLAALAAAPLTIADGHHRYETALRYRAERGRNRACESDPAWDYVFALVYPAGGSPPALPTHRAVLDGPVGDRLLGAIDGLVTVERLGGPDDLLARMSDAPAIAADASGSHRIGVVSGPVAAILTVRPDAVGTRLDPAVGAACRDLDVTALGVLLESAWGGDAGHLAGEGRLRYVKDPREAVSAVTHGEAATTFLLDPIPAAVITRVARAGEVMPQKSTYFSPKAPTGLLFSPMEW